MNEQKVQLLSTNDQHPPVNGDVLDEIFRSEEREH